MADSSTYDQATIARRQKIAEAMLSEGMKPRKIEHWAQGLAQLGQAGIGGYMSHLANEDAKASKAAEIAEIMSAFGGAGSSAPGATASAASPASAPTPDGTLPRGFRNNNPLNIEAGGFTQGQPGYAGSDGRFAKFDTMDSGTAAASKLLDTYERKYGLTTPAGIISRWAPQSDGNNVSAYAASVAKDLGIGPNDPITPEMRPRLIQAMAKFENGRALPSQAPVAQAMAPPQMPAVQPAASGGPLANATPQQRALIARGLAAPEGSPLRSVAASMMTQLMKPQEFGFQTLPDGTILRTDPRKGSVEPIYQAATKPTFGDIGEIDPQTGQPVKGFIDVNKRTVEPYRPKPTAEAQPSTIAPVPAGVDPKVWREAQSKRAAEEGMPADTKVVSALRNEVQGLPSYKNLAQASPVYKSMTEAAGRDNRAADVNLIYGMAKIMDPGSVVRESEMTVAQAIATLPQQLQAALKSQMTEAGRLTPELRQMIMQEARSRILAYQGMFDQDANMYRGIAQRGRMNEADVLPTFGPFDEFKSPKTTAPVTIDGYTIKAK